MKIGFISIVLIFIILYLMSKNRYKDYTAPLDRKEFPLKEFLGVGLLLTDIFRFRYSSSYVRKLIALVSELYGSKHAPYYYRIHRANKVVFIFLGLMLLSAIGAAGKADGSFAVFSVAFIAGIFYFTDRDLSGRVKKRRDELRLDFPEYLSKLALLINAGMTVSKASAKILADSKKDSPLYRELETTVLEMKAGKPEYKAYEDFAKRCGTPEITRFVSIVLQNLKKGSGEMVSILRLNAHECWELRKNNVRKIAEEASTKMLAPMMLMFVAVVLISATPAVLALRWI